MATHTVGAETIQAAIEENGIVVLDFWASWCGPCRAFAPTFEEASTQHDDIYFGKIDTEAERDLAGQLQIRSIPTLMVFRDQILVFRQPGALPAPAFQELLTKIKELDMDEVRASVAAQAAGESAESPATDA